MVTLRAVGLLLTTAVAAWGQADVVAQARRIHEQNIGVDGHIDTVQRIHRLLGPAEPLGRARRQLLRTTAAALALTPVVLALAPAVLALALGRLPAA